MGCFVKGGACGTIENSDARSASEFGNTSCPVLYDSRHKEVIKKHCKTGTAYKLFCEDILTEF